MPSARQTSAIPLITPLSSEGKVFSHTIFLTAFLKNERLFYYNEHFNLDLQAERSFVIR